MRKGVPRAGAAVLALAAIALVEAQAGAGSRADSTTTIHDLSLELVGQVVNTPLGVTPATSTQYGYVSYVRGLQVFRGDPQTEATALFTFYLRATTTRIISNGPLRILTRVGNITIYRDTTVNADFANPDSFRDGTPVLVAAVRQQVLVDTITSGFSTVNLSRITSTNPFPAGARRFELGDVGQRFKAVLSGHQNMPGPPSAFFAGYANS